MTIDASEHLGMLHHVVKSATLGIPDHMQDEALSEGLVLLQMACLSYDAKYRVPPHYWIAKKLRWGLKNWKSLEFQKHGNNIDLLVEYGEQGWLEDHPDAPHVDAIGQRIARLELHALVEQADIALSDKEYIALIGPAFGLHMKEISHMTGSNPNQIKALQERARAKIQEAL